MALRRYKSVDFLSEQPATSRRVVWKEVALSGHSSARDGTLADEKAARLESCSGVASGVASEEECDPFASAGLAKELELDSNVAMMSAECSGVGSPDLLRIIGDLDEVLLFRTQLRHSLETLRSARGFVEASLESLESTVGQIHPGTVEDGDPSSSNTPVAVDDSDNTRSLSRTGSSVDPAAPDGPRATESSTQTGTETSTYKALWEQVRQDFERVRRQEEEFTTTLDSLSSLEYRLNERQKNLVRDLRDSEKAAQVVNDIRAGPEVSSHGAVSAGSASDIPSVVERYFDRRGDVGVCIERGQELAEAWAEGLTEREFITDRGDLLEISDAEFNSKYAERQANIGRELQNARNDAEELERQCIKAGYDPQIYRTTRRSETMSDPDIEGRPPTTDSPVSSVIRQINLGQQGPQEQPTQRIDSWLRNVTYSGTETTEVSLPLSPVTIHNSASLSLPRSPPLLPEDTYLPPLPGNENVGASPVLRDLRGETNTVSKDPSADAVLGQRNSAPSPPGLKNNRPQPPSRQPLRSA